MIEAKTSGEEYKTEYLTISDRENPSIDEFYTVVKTPTDGFRGFFLHIPSGKRSN